jgi:hypothetical protein
LRVPFRCNRGFVVFGVCVVSRICQSGWLRSPRVFMVDEEDNLAMYERVNKMIHKVDCFVIAFFFHDLLRNLLWLIWFAMKNRTNPINNMTSNKPPISITNNNVTPVGALSLQYNPLLHMQVKSFVSKS